jgi:hypothetical protein
MATSHLGFEDNPLLHRLPDLLRDHDYLHDAVEELAERDGGHVDDSDGLHTEEHTEINVQITANVRELAAILGIQGVRGLLHLVDEILLEIGLDGIDLEDPDVIQAMAHMVEMPTDITKTMAAIGLFGGKVPRDRHLVEARLAELLASEELAIIQLG